MQVRTGHASGIPYQSDFLTALNRFTCRNERFAEVKIGGDHSASMIDVDHVTGKKEIIDKRNDPPIGSAHWISNRSAEIDAEVSSRYLAIE